jgi:Tol biopolymer transport system component
MPEYSPDGKRIAFVSQRGGGYAVWTMDANGKHLRRVTRSGKPAAVFPRWSPDGGSLVYSTLEPASVRRVRGPTVPARGSSPPAARPTGSRYRSPGATSRSTPPTTTTSRIKAVAQAPTMQARTRLALRPQKRLKTRTV